MHLLNDQFWISRHYKDQNPAAILRHVIQQIIAEFSHSQRLDYQAYAKSELYKKNIGILSVLRQFNPAEDIASTAGRTAFWLNTYNLLAINIVTKFYHVASTKDIADYFNEYGFKVSDLEFSLDIIEHGILRNNAPRYLRLSRILPKNDARLLQKVPLDPRIHFALYSAAISSPKLRVYDEDNFDQSLDVATSEHLYQQVNFTPTTQEVFLPKALDWYSKDFGGKADIRQFVLAKIGKRLSPEKVSLLKNGTVRFSDFDWSLNQYSNH